MAIRSPACLRIRVISRVATFEGSRGPWSTVCDGRRRMRRVATLEGSNQVSSNLVVLGRFGGLDRCTRLLHSIPLAKPAPTEGVERNKGEAKQRHDEPTRHV